MIVLHGLWSSHSNLCLWGEDSSLADGLLLRRKERLPRNGLPGAHPFACDFRSLREIVGEVGGELLLDDLAKTDLTLLLPSKGGVPQASPHLIFNEKENARETATKITPWSTPSLALSALDAITLTLSLPEGRLSTVSIGPSLIFFAEVAKLALEFVARGRVLPRLLKRGQEFQALWRAVTDGTDDRERLRLLARAMPTMCRAESINGSVEGRAPGAIVHNMIDGLVDAFVRQTLTERPLLEASGKGRRATRGLIEESWLAALTARDPQVAGSPGELGELQKQLDEWALPASDATRNALRTCFRLAPPADDETSAAEMSRKAQRTRGWRLEFLLQATDDQSLIIPADAVWKTRGDAFTFSTLKLENPQEKLLEDLGRATRLYPALEAALRRARPVAMELDVEGAYGFLRAAAPLLEQSGFGVLLPSWWKKPAARFGVKLKVRPKDESGKNTSSGLLGLEGICDYEWEVALGDEKLSFDDFIKLAGLKVPLVKVRGQWVELKRDEIEAALAFFAKHGAAGEMTVGEALRVGSGVEASEVGLPVIAVEGQSWLGQLFGTDGERRLSTIKTPRGFVGRLRPYQERGLSWLTFLGGFGLGACLADDMGLGKCASADTLIAVNGTLIKAEDIWYRYSKEAIFDGEGYWAAPTEQLLINSINGRTGQIVQAPIQKLYRQRVHERLRRIKLEDGSSITITRQHKLLTDRRWTNELRAGDSVCVPAKVIWEGKQEDPDLIKFLAWQIAEGHELRDTARLTITQKNVSVLEELQLCLHRFSEKYGIKISHPSVHTRVERAADLILHSTEYRRFLEARGYQWGKLSREKSIPPFVMQADLDSVRLFLSNYFDAEASAIESIRSIEISSASFLLMQQLSYLLRRFNIWLRISARKKCATNGTRILRTYYIGIIGGNAARKFCKDIRFSNLAKQERLERICERKSNTNIEGIPASELVAQTITTTRLPVRHLGMRSTVYINGTQQFSRTSVNYVLSAIDNILSGVAEQQYRALKPSKWTDQTLSAYAGLDRQKLWATRDHLKHLVDQEVFYCKIKHIEELEYDGWVYDFEVEEHHNFVANNILCHNTVQLLAQLVAERQGNGATRKARTGPTLLICPMSVVGNWQREAERFAPMLRIHVHHGAERLSGKKFARAAKKSDLVITTYALAARDRELLAGIDWHRAALDEAQNIKNPAAKQTQAVRSLRAAERVALTGTPVENRLSELWSIMEFLNPGLLGSASGFRTRFANPIERYRDEEKAGLLKRLTGPFILRRLKTDKNIIRDLPDKLEMKTFCNLTREQASLYQAVVDEMLEKIEESEGIERKGLVLSTLMKLKQICNHPAHLLQDGSKLENRSGKLARLEELLEEILAANERVLCFTQFAEFGHRLKQHVQERTGREVLFLHGGTQKKVRDAMVARFQTEDGPHIFLLSLKAGGTGLNLTAANHVIHFDRWWNPAVEDQATDRAFRIGQKKNVQVRKFICVGTLEERIDQMIEQKKELAARIVGTGEAWLTELSTAQIREMVALSTDAVSE